MPAIARVLAAKQKSAEDLSEESWFLQRVGVGDLAWDMLSRPKELARLFEFTERNLSPLEILSRLESAGEQSAETKKRSPDKARNPEVKKRVQGRMEGGQDGVSEIRHFEGHIGEIKGCVFTPDGHQVLSCANDGTIRRWELKSGEEVARIELLSMSRIVAFSPDARLAAWSSGGTNYVVLAKTDEVEWHSMEHFQGHTKGIGCVAFSPDGTHLLSGSADRSLRLWTVDQQNEVCRLSGHTNHVKCVAFSPDGNRAVSGGIDKTVRVWDLERGTEVACFRGHDDAVTSVSVSPDGSLVASAGMDYSVRVWELATGQEIQLFQEHSFWITCAVFSPDGAKILSAGHGVMAFKDPAGQRTIQRDDIRLWEVSTGEEVWHFKAKVNPVTGLAVAPDGRSFLVGGSAHWLEYPDDDIDSEKPVKEIRHANPISTCTDWSNSCRRVWRIWARIRNLCVCVNPPLDKFHFMAGPERWNWSPDPL